MPNPLGLTWLTEDRTYDFAIDSKYVERVTSVAL